MIFYLHLYQKSFYAATYFVQGTCQPLGCDGKLFSSLKVDSCGTCGGNNTECTKIETMRKKRLKRGKKLLGIED